MPRYFKKELPDRPIVLAGTAYKFDFWKLDDGDPRIPLLESCIKKRVGGIVELTAEGYDDALKKKQQPRKTLSGMPREELKQLPPGLRGVARRAVVGEVSASAPSEIVGVTGETPALPPVSKGVLS